MVIDRKKIILILTVLVFLGGSIVVFGGLLNFRQQFCYIYSPVTAQAATAPKNPELPMPKPSTITAEQDNIRLDLERVTVSQYYIVYSVIYGDESHSAYHLFLTDLNKNELDMQGISDIWLENDKGERVEQIALPTVSAYPEDQPLKWKIGIIAKFPHQATQGNHKLYLRYLGKTFVLTGIRY